MKKATRTKPSIQLPPKMDWRTSDEDEINRRRLRALEEQPVIRNLTPEHPIFSNFEVQSASGMTYFVEIRDIAQRHFHSTTVDFMINGLGTDKHVEAVLNYLQCFHAQEYGDAVTNGSPRADIVPDLQENTLRVERNLHLLPTSLADMFDKQGLLQTYAPEEAIAAFAKSRSKKFRISQEVAPWLESRQLVEDRVLSRRDYEWRIHSGSYPGQETKVPLFPYQRQGMLHLAFQERALLADEMGLGKTVQAVAACSLLHRLNKARRVLIVAPASLKTEWEEQINFFTELPYQLVYGNPQQRLEAYTYPPFFTITNYEQVMRDIPEINGLMKPDVVILDEAQRIKNWTTKTAQAIKRLNSRYAFVLTGTPIENRLDELYSIVNFIDPALLGPLFRFNREYYELDERGRPVGYKNLIQLHERIAPLLIRRRKSDVEDELPSRTDENYYVPLSPNQKKEYTAIEPRICGLLKKAEKRPLTKQENDLLMRLMNMARMICDTNYILNPDDEECPKLEELSSILDEIFSEPDTKVVIFSEWKRMLKLVQNLLGEKGVGYALHTGDISQKRRRGEIIRFKTDPDCRAFLSTESGGAGLNLQNANVIINCDLPWNPAKLEQRIARVWRKKQKRNVSVINLISENTIEHKMLSIHEVKRGLADGVLDNQGDYDRYNLKDRRQNFIKRLQQVMDLELPTENPGQPRPVTLPPDRALGMITTAAERFGEDILWAEEHYPAKGDRPVIMIATSLQANDLSQQLKPLYDTYFGDNTSECDRPAIEVVDTAALETIKRLEALGLISSSLRSKRPLYPPPSAATETEDAETQARLSDWRAQATRKIKTVNVLINAQLADEALPVMEHILLLAAEICALSNNLPQPESLDDLPKIAHHQHIQELQACRSRLKEPSDSILRSIIENCRRIMF